MEPVRRAGNRTHGTAPTEAIAEGCRATGPRLAAKSVSVDTLQSGIATVCSAPKAPADRFCSTTRRSPNSNPRILAVTSIMQPKNSSTSLSPSHRPAIRIDFCRVPRRDSGLRSCEHANRGRRIRHRRVVGQLRAALVLDGTGSNTDTPRMISVRLDYPKIKCLKAECWSAP